MDTNIDTDYFRYTPAPVREERVEEWWDEFGQASLALATAELPGFAESWSVWQAQKAYRAANPNWSRY